MLNGQNQLNNNPSQKEQIKQTLRQLKTIQNPQAMMQNYIMNNPNLNNALNLIRTVGNPRQAFINLAHQKGFTDEEINDIFK